MWPTQPTLYYKHGKFLPKPNPTQPMSGSDAGFSRLHSLSASPKDPFGYSLTPDKALIYAPVNLAIRDVIRPGAVAMATTRWERRWERIRSRKILPSNMKWRRRCMKRGRARNLDDGFGSLGRDDVIERSRGSLSAECIDWPRLTSTSRGHLDSSDRSEIT